MPWAKRISKRISGPSAHQTTFEINDYSKGYNSFVGNDKFPLTNGGSNEWRVSKNARITTFGEYSTRKGFDFHSAAVGETQDAAITAVTGASTIGINNATRIAQKFTSGATARLTKIDVNIKNDTSASGVVMAEIWSAVGGVPSALLATSSIAASTPSATLSYQTFYFVEAPSVTISTDYFIVLYTQDVSSGSYYLSTTTSATTAFISTDLGFSYSTTSYAINFKEYYATAGAVKGLFRAYKTDGTKVTLFVHGTSLYTVNNSTGALTAIKTGLNASATKYRFTIVNDVVYYVNGYDGYRKWDFTTESQVSATNYTHICQHKGMIFLVTSLDPNKIVFSNFGLYETFTSTDFIYIPAPKTGDPVASFASLNGYLYINTNNNRYILSGSDRTDFYLSSAPDHHGTFTQETTAIDKNYMYYLSNDGMYRSNGSQAELLSSNIYQEIIDLQNKADCVVEINSGRLYLWYRSANATTPDECYVWNLNFSAAGTTVESKDTKAYVARSFAAFNDGYVLLVGSSLVGKVFWQELTTNDYSNLGGIIEFELSTNYMSFASPAVLKEIRYWEPRFQAQSDSYTITCQYAYDLRDNWTTVIDQNTQGVGVKYGTGVIFGAGAQYGTTSELQSYIYVPGEYRRIALRYKNYAARQPHKFLGHTMVVQTRRIR